METLNSQETQPLHQALTLRNGEARTIDANNKIFGKDAELIKSLDITGDLVCKISIGDQNFIIVNVSKSLDSNGLYTPFGKNSPVMHGKVNQFACDDSLPLVLIQVSNKNGLIGRSLRSDKPTTLGREAEQAQSELKRFEYEDDDLVSRIHAQISLSTDGHIIVRDLESTNGTEIVYIPETKSAFEGESKTKPSELHATEISNNKDDINDKLLRSGVLSPEADNLMSNFNMLPSAEVNIDGKDFFISTIADATKDGNYQVAVLYTTIEKDGDDVIVPRLLYKSNSDGGWRVAYGVEGIGRYIKESRRGSSHYTQETKLQPEILAALEKVPSAEVYYGDIEELKENFHPNKLVGQPHPIDEIDYYTNPAVDGQLAPLRVVSSGELFRAFSKIRESELYSHHGDKEFNIAGFLVGLDGTFNSMPGFIPDFNKEPISVEHRKHTLLGDIIIEGYQGSIAGEPIIWYMAHDKDGRVWVDNIVMQKNKVSSYGTYSIIFDAGIVTSKPIDYKDQTSDLVYGSEKSNFNGSYDDITPLLDNLLPVRQYRQARKINRYR